MQCKHYTMEIEIIIEMEVAIVNNRDRKDNSKIVVENYKQ